MYCKSYIVPVLEIARSDVRIILYMMQQKKKSVTRFFRKKIMAKPGELWTDRAGLFVRSGSNFYKCSYDLLPRGSREYDSVTFSTDANSVVTRILTHVREPIHRRPRAFRPFQGVKVAKVTSYTRRVGGFLDYDTPFVSSVVKASGQGEVQVGEIVEFTLDDENKVSSITGPFGTHVTAVGRRLK
jgi:hypothetical protein